VSGKMLVITDWEVREIMRNPIIHKVQGTTKKVRGIHEGNIFEIHASILPN
jgi:hypothetical protein